MKKVKQQSSEKNRFILLVSILLLVLGSTLVANMVIGFNQPVYSKKIPVKFEISDRLGMVINTTVLDYGKVIPDTSITKELNLSNEYGAPMVVKVSVSPNLLSLIFGKKEIILNPGETKVYSVSLIPPSETMLGNYSGEINLDFYTFN